MESWRVIAALVEALLLVVLVLLWFDNLRERPGWSLGRGARNAGISSIIIPVGIIAVLVSPSWLTLVWLAVPALVVAVMALAS